MASEVLKNPPFVAYASTLGTSKMSSRNQRVWFPMCSSVTPLVVAKRCGTDSSDP
jgi:hypothetical protein